MHDLLGNSYIQKTENLGIPYMGSKRKYADTLITKMLEIKPNSKYFYDLFGGGGAISFAALQRGMTVFYNEKQTDLVELHKFIFNRMKLPRGKYGMFPDEYYNFVTRKDFMRLKNEGGVYAQFMRICYSFGNNQRSYMFNPKLEKYKHLGHNLVVFQCEKSAKKLSDYLGIKLPTSTRKHLNDRRLEFVSFINSTGRRFELQQLEQLQQLERSIIFTNLDYRDVKIETPINETIIYLDPPYRGTTQYKENFDYTSIDEYFRNIPYLAFMSEYNAPFKCVYNIETRSTLGAGNRSKKVERLYCNEY